MRLDEALEQTATAALGRMASAHGLVHDDSSTRAELIERLVERLSDADYVASELARLSEDETAVLTLARAHADGSLRGLLVERDYPTAAETLIERGLLFRVFSATGPVRGELYGVPDEILAWLPDPAPTAAPPVETEAPPGERRASDPAFSLFCIASALGRHGAQLEHEVRPWSEEPGGWAWDARWLFLRHLAESAGLLVHRADGALVGGPAVGRLLNDPPALFGRLWRAYLRDRSWSELAEIGVPDADDAVASGVGLRVALVDALSVMPEGQWIGLDALGAWLRRSKPNVVREQLSPRGLMWAEDRRWAELEQPLLRYLVLGPLYWLGAIGCTADGRHVVRRGAPARRGPEPCTWDGAAELVVPPRASLGTVLEAERYLVLQARGRPSRYHLVQAHVASALGSGGSLADCRRLLLKLSGGGGLPASVEGRLAAWEQRFGALTLRPAVLLEARAAAELDSALADERVQAFLRARLSPQVAEVTAADALELAAALREADHLPRVDAGLRLSADPRRAYAGLVDEQVLEFLLVSLLVFQAAGAEHLAALEGAATLLERLERQFPPERLSELRATAARLASVIGSGGPASGSAARRRTRSRAGGGRGRPKRAL